MIERTDGEATRIEAGRARRFGETADWSMGHVDRLTAALEAARRAAQLPAYRSEWAAAGLPLDALDVDHWSSIPLLDKERLIDAARHEPPFGRRLGVETAALAHVFVAPGPLYMPFTADDLQAIATSFAKALAGCGLRAGDLVDQTTMYNWVIAATVLDRALSILGCAVVPGGIGQTERHIEAIEALGVQAIVAFPTFLEHLLEQAASAGRRLPLRRAAVMGELSDPRTKHRLRTMYGLEVREFYGVADVGAVAWECEAGQGMHLRDDLLVEFVSPDDARTIEPGPGVPAEIVVTDFHRRAMPIVRLRTGDLVDGLAHGPCRCGRTSPRIARIVGRASEITKVKGMFVVPRTVDDVLRKNGLARPFRLVVDRDERQRDALTLEVAGAPPADLTPVQEQVEGALRMRIVLRFVEALPDGGPRLLDRRRESLGGVGR